MLCVTLLFAALSVNAVDERSATQRRWTRICRIAAGNANPRAIEVVGYAGLVTAAVLISMHRSGPDQNRPHACLSADRAGLDGVLAQNPLADWCRIL